MENLTMKDIAGYEEEKIELMQIIAMFRDFRVYRDRGVYLSKGLILSGEPGVGKTLFAKVLANEINAPFYYVDGSEYSGVGGVRRLKSVFSRARKKAPSVIFIDELNTFVGDRDYYSDDTKRNLSALLKLIDGIKSGDGVFVIGASSDKDGLDDAIVRSGRMDKHICLDTPNCASRRAILDYYLSKVDLELDRVNRSLVAEKTQGFNGADLKTLVNETMMECIYRDVPPTDELFLQHLRKIEERDINRAGDRRDLSLLAYHDLGHLIVSKTLLHRYDEISLFYESENNGNSSISSLFRVPDEDDEEDEATVDLTSYDSGSTIADKICVLLGGAAAEQVFFGERYLTSRNDLVSAVKLINAAFENGLQGFDYVNHDTYYYMEASQALLVRMEKRRAEILEAQFERAIGIVTGNRELLSEMHAAVVAKKALSEMELKAMLD